MELHKMHYLLGAKPGDHQHLFEQVIANMDEDNYRTETQQVASAKQKLCTAACYVADVSLNKTHADLKVNFLRIKATVLSTTMVMASRI